MPPNNAIAQAIAGEHDREAVEQEVLELSKSAGGGTDSDRAIAGMRSWLSIHSGASSGNARPLDSE